MTYLGSTIFQISLRVEIVIAKELTFFLVNLFALFFDGQHEIGQTSQKRQQVQHCSSLQRRLLSESHRSGAKLRLLTRVAINSELLSKIWDIVSLAWYKADI